MPETRTVKGFAEVLLPFAAEDFECFDLIRSYCTLEENMRTYRKLKEC